MSTVKGVTTGEVRLPIEVMRRVFAGIRRRAGVGEEVALTPREKEILASFSYGLSYATIAEARGVKPVTIGTPSTLFR